MIYISTPFLQVLLYQCKSPADFKYNHYIDFTWASWRLKPPATQILFWLTSKKSPQLDITDHLWKQSPVTGGFASQRTNNACENVVCKMVTILFGPQFDITSIRSLTKYGMAKMSFHIVSNDIFQYLGPSGTEILSSYPEALQSNQSVIL